MFKQYLRYAKKALGAGALAVGAGLLAGFSDGNLTQAEVVLAVSAFVPAALAVFGLKNGEKPVKVTDEEIENLLSGGDIE
jgi:hypothetical protein